MLVVDCWGLLIAGDGVEDESGAYWFNALCREFDEPFTLVRLR